ncbi:MAG: type II secretion system F family protein [Actinobacteria bacterium]|nr:type II secretion system F family protein [Actinomycetota bacterium]
MSGALDEVRARLEVGAPVPPDADLHPRLHRALQLARAVGAPALPALDAAAAALDDDDRRRRALQVATAQARTVAVGLVVLPLLALPVFGAMTGVDVLGFYASPAGRVVAVLAVGLFTAGAAIAALLLRSATADRPDRLGAVTDLDEVADLVATALSSGAPAGFALRATARVLPHHAAQLERLALVIERGVAPSHPVSPRAGFDRIAALVRTGISWGAPVAPSLRRLGRDVRAERLAAALARAEALPARLTFPTALCLLPATVLSIGAPLLASGLAAAGT